MANRQFKQTHMSFEKAPVHLFSKVSLAQLGTFASLANQGLTYTADAEGTVGNSITVALVDPADTDQALAVSVTGSAITVSLATDSLGAITSTATLIAAAVNANAAAAALVTVTGSGASAVTELTATALSGGVDYAGDSYGIKSVRITGTGAFAIELEDKYTALLSAQITIQKASAADLQPQLVSEDVDGTKIIAFKTLAGATATALASGDVLYIHLVLRNSTK